MVELETYVAHNSRATQYIQKKKEKKKMNKWFNFLDFDSK
jgi:hypothetical protein